MFARLNTVILLVALMLSPISTDDKDDTQKKCCADCDKLFKYCCIQCALNDTESEVCELNCRIDLGICSHEKCHIYVCPRP
ncbi:hypothetical protein GPALN_010285 [Globodera pallida]|uniref:UPF0506 domain-containing protein n=1 Tax=Globodera pallida TaxID=36090 RepID=A0A183CQZ7_GLOPA|nr:hypothetical protein GPALN_010285 [Globodera pallida]